MANLYHVDIGSMPVSRAARLARGLKYVARWHGGKDLVDDIADKDDA